MIYIRRTRLRRIPTRNDISRTFTSRNCYLQMASDKLEVDEGSETFGTTLEKIRDFEKDKGNVDENLTVRPPKLKSINELSQDCIYSNDLLSRASIRRSMKKKTADTYELDYSHLQVRILRILESNHAGVYDIFPLVQEFKRSHGIDDEIVQFSTEIYKRIFQRTIEYKDVSIEIVFAKMMELKIKFPEHLQEMKSFIYHLAHKRTNYALEIFVNCGDTQNDYDRLCYNFKNLYSVWAQFYLIDILIKRNMLHIAQKFIDLKMQQQQQVELTQSERLSLNTARILLLMQYNVVKYSPEYVSNHNIIFDKVLKLLKEESQSSSTTSPDQLLKSISIILRYLVMFNDLNRIIRFLDILTVLSSQGKISDKVKINAINCFFLILNRSDISDVKSMIGYAITLYPNNEGIELINGFGLFNYIFQLNEPNELYDKQGTSKHEDVRKIKTLRSQSELDNIVKNLIVRPNIKDEFIIENLMIPNNILADILKGFLQEYKPNAYTTSLIFDKYISETERVQKLERMFKGDLEYYQLYNKDESKMQVKFNLEERSILRGLVHHPLNSTNHDSKIMNLFLLYSVTNLNKNGLALNFLRTYLDKVNGGEISVNGSGFANGLSILVSNLVHREISCALEVVKQFETGEFHLERLKPLDPRSHDALKDIEEDVVTPVINEHLRFDFPSHVYWKIAQQLIRVGKIQSAEFYLKKAQESTYFYNTERLVNSAPREEQIFQFYQWQVYRESLRKYRLFHKFTLVQRFPELQTKARFNPFDDNKSSHGNIRVDQEAKEKYKYDEFIDGALDLFERIIE